MTTRQLLDSQGPMMKKDPTTIRALIEEFATNSQEYHKPREDITRGKVGVDGGN